MSQEWEIISNALCIVGESPLYDGERDLLYYVDIHGRRLRRMEYSSGKVQDFVLPQQAGAVVLDTEGKLIGCMEDGVYRIASDGKIAPLFAPLQLRGMRFNDVKTGPDGALYGGTIDYRCNGAFYRISGRGECDLLLDRIGNSNGLDWDTEKGVIYYNDTPTRKTECLVYADHKILSRTAVREFLCSEGNPDGMTLDSENKLWIALWGHGKLLRIDPQTGATLREIQLPVSNVSCCAFAGKDLRDLVVTTAAHNTNLREEPLAGALFRIRVDVPGRPVFRFNVGDSK